MHRILIRSFSESTQRTLLLLSGGVESSVLLYQIMAYGHIPVPLFANYSQRGANAEYAAAISICAKAGINSLRTLDLQAEGAAHQSINKLHIPLPHRNLSLLSLALNWATTESWRKIALGLNRDDFAKDAEFAAQGAVRYTTGTKQFVEKFQALAQVVAPSVEIILPQAEMTKADVIQEGIRLGVPMQETYSCMRGRPIHCGRWLQCRSRRSAFIEADVEDDIYEY